MSAAPLLIEHKDVVDRVTLNRPARLNALDDSLVVRFQHSHPIAAGVFANVGIERPLAISIC